jgi:hypothetical protein
VIQECGQSGCGSVGRTRDHERVGVSVCCVGLWTQACNLCGLCDMGGGGL